MAEMTRAERNRRRGAKWPVIIVSLLVLNVGVCAVTVVAAARSKPVVEPDYYQRAVDWDARRKAEPDIESLGWSVASSFEGPRAEQIVLRFTDGDGTPILGHEITGECFHQAFAHDRRELTVTEAEPGVYRAAWPSDVKGLWELRLKLKSDDGTVRRYIGIVELDSAG